ncbi:hypothetical protein OAK45_00600 [Verrucomicrobia bacterium]|nr:hypothetical protein [Verrucomicrobiota bacterium]
MPAEDRKRKPTELNFIQWHEHGGKGFWRNVHSVHHAQEQAVGVIEIIQIATTLGSTTTCTEHHHRQLRGVIMPSEYAGAERE